MGGMMGKKLLAQMIGLVVGIAVWVACGAAGLFLTVGAGDSWIRNIGGWIGLFACASVFQLVSRALEKKWGITTVASRTEKTQKN
jgi:hypothetical protein